MLLYLSFIDSSDKEGRLRLHDDMQKLEVLIKFDRTVSDTNVLNNWCDAIRIFIIYGTFLEYALSEYVTLHII